MKKTGNPGLVSGQRTQEDRDEALIACITHAMMEKKGERVVSMDLREVPGAAFDFFVLQGSTDAGASSFYNTKTGGSTLESLLGYTPIKVNLAYLKGWWV